MENKNIKIESFFSNQLTELKATYDNKRVGKVCIEATKDKALTRCLELADWGVVMSDITWEEIYCSCDNEKMGYVCVNPQTYFFFVVSVCDCENKKESLL